MGKVDPGIIFIVNDDASRTNRNIPGGQIVEKHVTAKADGAGGIWINVAIRLKEGAIHTDAFEDTRNTVGYYPFANAATGETRLDDLKVSLQMNGTVLQATMVYLVPDGKIGGAST